MKEKNLKERMSVRMNNSGDVAEQMMRMSLEGAEVAVKLTGTGALKLASIIYKVLQQQEKTKGKARLTSMLRSGKSLKVFTVKEEQLKRFSEEAKRYGVLYCVLKDKDTTDGLVDVMVRAEDASKINRIVTRFNIATVDTASIKTEVENDKDKTAKTEPQIEKPEKSKEDKLLDDLMRKPVSPEKSEPDNPFAERTERSNPSGNNSEKQRNFASEGTIKRGDKPSVREEIKRIQERRRNNSNEAPLKKVELKSPQKSSKEKER